MAAQDNTATLQHQFDVAEKAGKEVFYSAKHRGLQLQRQRTIRAQNALGNDYVAQEPVIYRFAPNGMITVEPGQDVLPDGPGGAEQDAIAWLTSHPRYGHRFVWKGHEPGRPLPSDEDFLGMVNVATANRDFNALDELEEQEQRTHQRSMLLAAVVSARKALESVKPGPPTHGEPELPEGYDRAEAVAYLQARDIAVPDGTTDQQIVAMFDTLGPEEDEGGNPRP
jgi:hypothetical protein